nr:MAG: hypothetical protein [Bacteriophage sp.]
MPRKDKVIHISNLPSTFRGNVTRNGRFIQNGIPPLGGAYDKVAKSTGLIRLGNEFLYNGVNNLVSKDNREKLMNNTAGRLINYVKDFNKESFPSDDELGPTFPFNIIQTPRSNGKKLPQKQYAVGGKVPNVVAGGIAQPLGNNFFYMNGRKHSQGGIDIGPSDKTGIEVEGGEVVETNGNELKVYSAQPILNGASPAQLVMGGANPNKVFKAQEDFKDRNGINDDGTKAKYGKEKYVVKSDNTRVTPIMESPRNSGIKQGDFIYHPETYRIANNTLEKVPARKEVNMTPLEQINPEFDILLGGAGVLRSVDKATKIAMALDKNISRTSQKAITKGRDALGYYSISPNIRYNLSVNNGRKALGVKPTKLLEAPKKQLTSNIGKYKDFVNILDSNGKVIDIPDVLQTNIDDTKAFLKTFNKWNARYGYDPIPLSAAKNPKQADKLIKDRLLEHNTFIRGVHETGNEENINNILRRNGVEPTPENRAKYYASTYAPDTGAGRAGFNSSYNGEGTIYSSNSLNTGIGYAKAKHRNEKDGFVVSVRRPIKFEGNYYNNVNNKLGKLLSKNYRKYVEKQFNKQYRKAINKEIAKNGITDDELKEYIESKGIHPEHKKYNVITSEKLVKSSRNEGNPYQHFIFTGDVGKQGFEVIDIVDVNSDKFKGIPYTRDHFGKYTKGYSRKSRKLGGKNMIVSISGNVKNGLIHSPSSTGGLRDKFAIGGKRINRHGRTWEYDEQNGYYVPITNRTINRTSAYPINKSARGETIVGSDYTFRNGKWSKNSIINNNVNNNTNKSNIDNGNRRPQYYAERRLPLFEDGAGITSGLVRAGWSHGNNRGISTNNTNILSLSATKSSGKTPRGGRSKSSQSTQSVPTKTPPIAVYNRNLPKVEANIPTTLPVSTSTPAKGTTSSDGKGQGKFKNITAADWIGLGSNMAGSLASYFASRRTINKMRGPGQPTLISANKLKTKYNINPQLDRIREDKFEAYRDIDSNTASSRVSLARKQRVRNAAGQAANELYGNKENIETNLINQDRRNQQSVRQFNAQQYNQYIDRKAAFDNGIREAKVTNINNLFSGINAGIQDMISRYENRKALNNTIGAMRASAPNVDDRIMRDAGVDYDEFIIRKRRKLGGKQSCR